MKNNQIDATQSMNTHIFAIFCNLRAPTAQRLPPTRPRVGGREALSPPAKFQKFAKMWVFIDRVASIGLFFINYSINDGNLLMDINYGHFLNQEKNEQRNYLLFDSLLIKL